MRHQNYKTTMATIKTKELKKLGFIDDISRSLAVGIIAKHCKHQTEQEVISHLEKLIATPEKFINDDSWGVLAKHLSPQNIVQQYFDLRTEVLPYTIYGTDNIEELAKQQMSMAMRLPVSVAGALMPDGHAGYGLPIGGVLATDGVVIPYAVGLDIACRMSLTILDADTSFIEKYQERCIKALVDNTAFGLDAQLQSKHYHEMFDSVDFRDIPLLKKLRAKAVAQLGSSGRGNHFVDICEVHLDGHNTLGLEAGQYVGILSHSGSRGFGAEIAEYYTKVAKERCKLPREAGPFVWLDMKSDAGEEYWHCMTLAGEYSAVNHQIIHANVAKALRLKPLLNISNHHNFAWKEKLNDGREVIVHRKGATPAHLNELGIIPGSMATPGYIVSGLGCEQSLYSASHGAGRAMSRQDAKNTFSRHALKKYLAAHNVELIGGSTEEAPLAYKDIDAVMLAQRDLINVVGKIIPRIVRMSEE